MRVLKPRSEFAPEGQGLEPVEFYDQLHGDLPEGEHALYRPLNRLVVERLLACGSRSILEVGCGRGELASLILRQVPARYRGFDYSRAGVENARATTGWSALFSIGNALDPNAYAGPDYDTIVCCEVLEHIDRDLDVIKLWKPGTWCICSVPNFDYAGHVRFFRSEAQVRDRFGHVIDIASVERVARPVMPHGFDAYLKQLRWSRNDWRRLLGLLGVNTFEYLSGWFVLCGRRNSIV